MFYIVEKDGHFHEKFSVRKNFTPEDKHIEVVIPEDKIYRLRFDFGSNPGRVTLKNLELKADTYMNFNDWNHYDYVNIERHKALKNGWLKLYSTHVDPQMIFKPEFVFYKTTE